MKKTLILLLLAILIFAGCKDEPTPPEQLPEGYQQDIPWPSLADSPWPMNHHDPQSTGRSSSIEPLLGIIQSAFDSLLIDGGVVVGEDSTIYFFSCGAIGFREGGLYSLKDSKLNCLYKHHLIKNPITPIVTSNNSIIFSTYYDSEVISVKTNGELNWIYNSQSYIWSNLNIDKIGNIYFMDTTWNLYSLNKSGNLNWKLKIPGQNSLSYRVPSISFSADGNSIYIRGTNSILTAVDLQTQSILWSFGEKNNLSSSVIDNQNNIYMIGQIEEQEFAQPYLLKVSSMGQAIWQKPWHKIDREGTFYTPSIDTYGNIYFGIDTETDSLNCFDNNGNAKWKKPLSNCILCSDILTDAVQNIYLMVLDLTLGRIKVIKTDMNGNTIFELLLPNGKPSNGSSAIANNMLIIATDKKLYLLK